MSAADPIRSKAELKKLADYYLHRGELRNYALVVLGVNTALRISDLLTLKWTDIIDSDKGKIKSRVNIRERKTGKKKSIALNKKTMEALKLYYHTVKSKGHIYIFQSNRRIPKPISRVQAYRIIRRAADALGLAGTISCHTLRKTFGYHAWNKGFSVAVIMDIYNHSSYDITKRYLGVSQDDRDKVYLNLSLL